MSAQHPEGDKGARAANETKGVFQAIGDMGEDLRKNVNAFADNLLGGDKSTKSTAGGTGDIHPDAKKAEDALKSGVDKAKWKVNDVLDQNKHH